MIRTVVECNFCGKQQDIQRLGLFGNYSIPAGWFTVAANNAKAEHYCSRECMMKQAEKLHQAEAEAQAQVAPKADAETSNTTTNTNTETPAQ
jgi:hypothetical protein